MRVIEILATQRLCFGIFSILKVMDVDLVLALCAVARGTKIDWVDKPDLYRFLNTFVEEIISVLPVSAPLRQASVSGERVKEGGTHLKDSECYGGFASRGLSKAYAHKAWGRFNNAGKDLRDLSTLDVQDALTAGKVEVVAARPEVAATPVVGVDATLAVTEDENWKLKISVGLDEVERIGVRHKLRELQKETVSPRNKRF